MNENGYWFSYIIFGVQSFPVLLFASRKSQFMDQISFIVCASYYTYKSTYFISLSFLLCVLTEQILISSIARCIAAIW